jgi:raffinose/stachyose/melibiose transport system substrate-binding protein
MKRLNGAPRAGSRVRRHRRAAALTATVAAALLVTVACSSGSSSGSAAGGVTLTVQTFTAPEGTALTAVADQYHKLHPGVSFNVEQITQQQSRTTNQQLLASSSPPDIGFIQPGLGVYESLAKNGDLESLAGMWQSSGLNSHAIDSLKSVYTQNGAIHGLYAAPSDSVDFAMIWYNKTEFAQAGITIPADHQLPSAAYMDTIAAKLKAKGFGGLALGGDDGYMLGFPVDALLGGAATPAQFTNLLTNWHPNVPLTTSYTSGPFLRVLNTINDWNKHNVFVPGVTSLQDDPYIALFSAGRAGMMDGGVWSPALISADKATFPLGYFLLPSLRGGTTPYDTWPANAYVIPKNAQHKQQSEQFLSYLESVPAQEMVAKITASFPVRTDIPQAKLSSLLGPLSTEVFTQAAKVGTVPEYDTSVAPQMAQAFEQTQLQKMLSGSSTPAAVAQAYQSELHTVRGS